MRYDSNKLYLQNSTPKNDTPNDAQSPQPGGYGDQQPSSPASHSHGSAYEAVWGRSSEQSAANGSPYRGAYASAYTPPVSVPAVEASAREPKGRARFVALVLTGSLLFGAAGGSVSHFLLGNKPPESSGTQALAPLASTGATEKAAAASTVYTTSDIAQVAQKAAPSVVEISVQTQGIDFFRGSYTARSGGSGVIVSEDGYIVTNVHVVAGADQILLRTSDGKEYEAVLIGTDAATDLAVIKVDASGLTPAELADSDSIQVGQLAIAIGNPLGTLGGTVTEGIISAKDREITIDSQTMNLLQTSAAVNPGNSGGGLFDASGRLVGVVNAKSAGVEVEGLGFAIPSNTVRLVVDEIIDNGYVTGRPELGVSVLDVFDEQTAQTYRLQEYGVYVTAVTRENGLRSGDRILRVDGQELESGEHLGQIISECEVGQTLQIVVARDGAELTVETILAEQAPEYVQQQVRSEEL